jgi:hypothetical protein
VYGVPADLDLSGFVGAVLERIDLGQFILHFRFSADPERVISVEGDWELRAPNSALLDHQMEPAVREAYRLHVLLGQASRAMLSIHPRRLCSRSTTATRSVFSTDHASTRASRSSRATSTSDLVFRVT